MPTSRFTHVTTTFSKKGENLAHAVPLQFMYRNSGRIHRKTLKVTPTMEIGITIPLGGWRKLRTWEIKQNWIRKAGRKTSPENIF